MIGMCGTSCSPIIIWVTIPSSCSKALSLLCLHRRCVKHANHPLANQLNADCRCKLFRVTGVKPTRRTSKIKLQSLCPISPVRRGYTIDLLSGHCPCNAVRVIIWVALRHNLYRFFSVYALYNKKRLVGLFLAVYLLAEFGVAMWIYCTPGSHCKDKYLPLVLDIDIRH